MNAPSARSSAPEQGLLEAARGGDENAFGRLVEPYRGELHAHCYRMLGSLHDAEDAYQDALLRAWRGLSGLESQSSLRAWLYRIATNTCLDTIAKRPKRVLPVDYGPEADPHDGPKEPVVESVWVEPYPDEVLAVEDGYTSPEARFEQREGLELAFIAALQLLPANQRAALILREVLGFSAKEVAALLDTSVPSVNSALQRARKTLDERLPEQSQQETLRTLGDDGVREVVEGYMDAMQRGDVDAVVSMLAEDAVWSMPPATVWYRGHQALTGFLEVGPLSGDWRWRHLPAHANGQAAVGTYHWDPDQECYLPFALDMLTLDGKKITAVTSFIVRTTELDAEKSRRWPEHPLDPEMTHLVFERNGLPARLD
jgi:RNA polymerase sigma-70 factor (ECF subfamily)